ncbi:hypothetical protein C8Q78DRAFT_833977 [Trametes maxima]|nr:hypothetical protein C8Q78DRAFT_833977 [Trametes maxima]
MHGVGVGVCRHPLPVSSRNDRRAVSMAIRAMRDAMTRRGRCATPSSAPGCAVSASASASDSASNLPAATSECHARPLGSTAVHHSVPLSTWQPLPPPAPASLLPKAQLCLQRSSRIHRLAYLRVRLPRPHTSPIPTKLRSACAMSLADVCLATNSPMAPASLPATASWPAHPRFARARTHPQGMPVPPPSTAPPAVPPALFARARADAADIQLVQSETRSSPPGSGFPQLVLVGFWLTALRDAGRDIVDVDHWRLDTPGDPAGDTQCVALISRLARTRARDPRKDDAEASTVRPVNEKRKGGSSQASRHPRRRLGYNQTPISTSGPGARLRARQSSPASSCKMRTDRSKSLLKRGFWM